MIGVEQFIGNIEVYLQGNRWLAVAAVFTGGALSAAAPCVLIMIPLMMSYVAGRDDRGGGALRAFGLSLLFVVGMSITFTAFGFVAALAGKLYGDIPGWWNFVVALVCLVMGLHLLGVLRFTVPTPVRVQPKARGAAGALVLGMLFGLVSAPCAAPILVVLLTYVAGADSSILFGGSLLFAYALGHGLLVLVAGTSMGAARKLIESKGLTRATAALRRAGGVMILLIGIYFALKGA